MPRHIAIIMDGNGRWAKQRDLPRAEGHRCGAAAVRRVVEESRRLGIKYLTLFAFSTENWRRPKDEVNALMKLFAQYLESEVDLLIKHGIRLKSIGELERLSPDVRESLNICMQKTSDCSEMQLIIAISYGSRQEITQAALRMAADIKSGSLQLQNVNEQIFSHYLYDSELPDPDLLIRTSDEYRISNFMLWQLAYSEILVSPVLWPDFTEAHLQDCIKEFSKRKRRFGMTEEQLSGVCLQNSK